MKKYLLLLGLTLASYTPSIAQACSKYYPLEEGVKMEYTLYNGKGKEEGRINYLVTDSQSDGNSTSATMQVQYMDDKGKELFGSEYKVTCEDNQVHIDFESLMSQQMMQQFEEMEVEISGTDLELPNDLSEGQELPDANVNMKVNMGAMNMNMSVETINRKVEKKESVTTAAGTYDCFVIYSENQTKMVMANKTFPSRLWLAEGVGMVRQENYNQKGKLDSYMELTAFSR